MSNNSSTHSPVELNCAFAEYPGNSSLIIPLYIVLYSVITVFSILGNLIIIIAITFNPCMRNVVFHLLVCLSFSDFLFALMSPLHVRSTLYPGKWDLITLGDYGCKIYYFLFRGFYAFSVIIMVVIAVDRYLIMRMKISVKKQHKLRRAVSICVALSAITPIPLLFVVGLGKSDVNECYTACTIKYWKEWVKVYYCLVYALLYVLPLLTLFVIYTIIWKIVRPHDEHPLSGKSAKHRRMIANMLTVIVVAFFVCWTPYTVMEAIVIFNYPKIITVEFETALNYVMLLVYVSGAINPVFYGFFSHDVRKSIKLLLSRFNIR